MELPAVMFCAPTTDPLPSAAVSTRVWVAPVSGAVLVTDTSLSQIHCTPPGSLWQCTNNRTYLPLLPVTSTGEVTSCPGGPVNGLYSTGVE